MFDALAYAARSRSVATAATGLGAYILPPLTLVTRIACAGGVLGAVTGLFTGGIKCVDLQERGALDVVVAVHVLGRDLATGAAAGMAGSAASLYVSVAGAAVCTVISAPAWIPTAAAVAPAVGVAYVVTRKSREVWDNYIA